MANLTLRELLDSIETLEAPGDLWDIYCRVSFLLDLPNRHRMPTTTRAQNRAMKAAAKEPHPDRIPGETYYGKSRVSDQFLYRLRHLDPWDELDLIFCQRPGDRSDARVKTINHVRLDHAFLRSESREILPGGQSRSTPNPIVALKSIRNGMVIVEGPDWLHDPSVPRRAPWKPSEEEERADPGRRKPRKTDAGSLVDFGRDKKDPGSVH